MEIPEKIDFEDVYALYAGRRDDVKEFANPEILQVADRVGLQKRMTEIAQEAAISYQRIHENSPEGFVDDSPELKVNSVPILARVVDASIPLTMFVMKTFKHDKYSGRHSKTVMVQLVKGFLDGDNPKALHSAWKAKYAEGNVIGGLDFADRGEVFDLRDREINPKFRRQGFANMLLETSEEFVRAMATEAQAPRIFQGGDVGQLDVLCWLWNKGYRPKKDGNEANSLELIQEIFSGDSSLCLATLTEPAGGLDLCIIDANTPTQERIRQNYHSITKKVDLVKEINPGDSKRVADISTYVTAQVKNFPSGE